MDVAFGGEGEATCVAVEIAESYTGCGAVAESHVGAQEQEEMHPWAAIVEEQIALLVGCDHGAGLRLVEARDGSADCLGGCADVL